VASVCSRWAAEAQAKARQLAVLRCQGPLGRTTGTGPAGLYILPPRLSHPTHVVVLPGGEVVVAECATSQLLHLSAEGELLGTLGARGAGASEVAAPRGLACDGEALYVADGGNGRVQKRWLTEPERTVAESSGELEGLPEPLRRPEGLALADGALYVSDRPRHRILVYEADGLRLRAATSGERGSGDGQLCDPGGLAVLGDELVVADVSNHRLACFGLGCTYRRAIGRRGTVPQRLEMLPPPPPRPWWCHSSTAPSPSDGPSWSTHKRKAPNPAQI
jgi:hypothetical protein